MSAPVPKSIAIAFVVLALILPSATACFYFVVLAAGGHTNPVQQGVYVAGKVVQFSLPLLFLVIVRQFPRPRTPIFRGVALGLGFGLLVSGAALALYFGILRDTRLLAVAPAKISQKVREMGVDSPLRFLALAVFLSVGHSLLEEYYYRWFVYGQLRELVPNALAIVIAAVGFMGHHVIILGTYLPGQELTLVVPLSLGIGVGGAFWCWLYGRSGSLLGPWLGHLLIDVVIFVIGWDLISRGHSV